MKPILIALYAIFFLLQLGDIYTTIRCLRNPLNYESYRLTAWLMSRIGTVQAIVLIRGLSIILVGGLVWVTRDILPAIVPMVVLGVLIVWYVRIDIKSSSVGRLVWRTPLLLHLSRQTAITSY